MNTFTFYDVILYDNVRVQYEAESKKYGFILIAYLYSYYINKWHRITLLVYFRFACSAYITTT